MRAEIQASQESEAVLAVRYGVSQTPIRRWRARSETSDRGHVRHNLGEATSPPEEAIIAELSTLAGLSLDDITEAMNRCLNPGLSRGSIWRALRQGQPKRRRTALRWRASASSTSISGRSRSWRARASASSSPSSG